MKNIECFIILSNVPWNWTADYINQTAIELSKKAPVVCFYWYEAKSVRQLLSAHKFTPILEAKTKDIFGYTPVHFIPFRRYGFIRWLNLKLNIQLLRLCLFYLYNIRFFSKTVFWLFNPGLWEVKKQFDSTAFSVYDCVDFWRGATRLSTDKIATISSIEDEVVRDADIVSVNSRVLYAFHRKKRKNILLVPQGFRMTVSKSQLFRDEVQTASKQVVIGYVGAINSRLHFRLLHSVIRRLPAFHFIFVGPLLCPTNQESKDVLSQMDKLTSMPNVIWYRNVNKEHIPEIIGRCRICIIPYDTSQLFNKYSYPMKLFEYFYMGKPVVSTPIEELKRFPEYVRIASSSREWKKCITELSGIQWSLATKKQQRELAEYNSWENKISDILVAIDQQDRVVKK